MKAFPRNTKHKRKHSVRIEKALFNSIEKIHCKKVLLKPEKKAETEQKIITFIQLIQSLLYVLRTHSHKHTNTFSHLKQ